MDLSINLAPNNIVGLSLKNPIMIASGTFGYDGYGRGIPSGMDLSQLGAVIPKTVTRHPREGNPEPRWYPTSYREAKEQNECIYLNSIGLANPGIEAALSDLAPIWSTWPATIILSLSGNSPSEFAEMAGMTKGVAGFEALELNLSCPNIESGALFAHSADLTYEVVKGVRANSHLPILVKLAPNVPDIIPIAQAAESAGADALTLPDHATGDLVSGEYYRRYLRDMHIEFAQVFDAPLILHICGKTVDRMEYIAQTGMAAFHYDSKNDPCESMNICQHRITLVGNINNPETLYSKGPEEVRQEVLKNLDARVQLVGPECAIPLQTSIENLKEIPLAVKQWHKQHASNN